MLISKKNRVAIYSYLLREGVAVAPKDWVKPKHDEVDVPNLQFVKTMQSLVSRGYVRETFSWQWYYYFLTDEGIEYLREYLHLPADVVPLTLKKQAPRPARAAAGFGGDRHQEGGYGKGKDMGPDGNFKPSFRGEGGGFGRGGREGGYRREGGGF
mmetsp:Transcript_179120/g.435849  ORF Transcript_179120/g.435849 Transcript_179120/m.435849 type:complete len:155 (+) Transcript_179120:37-501(+)